MGPRGGWTHLRKGLHVRKRILEIDFGVGKKKKTTIQGETGELQIRIPNITFYPLGEGSANRFEEK